MRCRAGAIFGLLLGSIVLGPRPVDAAPAGNVALTGGVATMAASDDAGSGQRSVDDAGHSLGRWRRFPWYDAARDDLKPVLTGEPDPPKRQPPTRSDFSLLKLLAWTIIAIVLAGLVWLIVMSLQEYWGWGESKPVGPRVGKRVDHVEALPFLKQRSLDDLLGQAREHYLAGDFNEAIVCLYSYQLVELDRRNLIRLAAGKTNRQYLRELRGRPTLAGLLEQSMVAFEDVYFGNRQLERQRFEHCWNRLAEFETIIGANEPTLTVPQPIAAGEPAGSLAEMGSPQP